MEAAGIGVVHTVGLAIADPRRCADLSPEHIVAQALTADHPDADAVFLSCANLRGLEAAARLESALGKPVATSNQAVLWAMLRLVGIENGVPGGGRLFQLQ